MSIHLESSLRSNGEIRLVSLVSGPPERSSLDLEAEPAVDLFFFDQLQRDPDFVLWRSKVKRWNVVPCRDRQDLSR